MEALRYVAELIISDPAEIPVEIRFYLERCLLDILNGHDPAQSLNLKKKPHQREYPPIDYWRMVRDADMAKGVAYYRQNGLSLEQACERIASEYDAFTHKCKKVKEDAVKKAYLRFFPAEEESG